MGRSVVHLIWVFIIGTLALQGCTYVKLVSPGAYRDPLPLEPLGTSRREGLKFSYIINKLENRHSVEQVEKALLDSFLAAGMRDIAKSEEVSSDRIYVIVNMLNGKPTTFTRYSPGVPWILISEFTLTLIPFYDAEIYPVEIHIIDPHRAEDKRFKIIRAEYTTASWTWLPFVFMINKETSEDSIYFNRLGMKTSEQKSARLEYVAYRRIFDGVISELARQ